MTTFEAIIPSSSNGRNRNPRLKGLYGQLIIIIDFVECSFISGFSEWDVLWNGGLCQHQRTFTTRCPQMIYCTVCSGAEILTTHDRRFDRKTRWSLSWGVGADMCTITKLCLGKESLDTNYRQHVKFSRKSFNNAGKSSTCLAFFELWQGKLRFIFWSITSQLNDCCSQWIHRFQNVYFLLKIWNSFIFI